MSRDMNEVEDALSICSMSDDESQASSTTSPQSAASLMRTCQAGTRLSQFNRLRVRYDRAGRLCWHGKYRDDREERVSKEWVDDNFKPFFVVRCQRNLGRWCYVPVGRQEIAFTSPSHGTILNGIFSPGYAPELTPEVRFMMMEGNGDYCLSYSSASALHHLGDTKLPSLLVQHASAVAGHERQMEVVRYLLRVSPDTGLTFGCMSAVDVFRGNRKVTLLVYDSPRRLYVDVVPTPGELYLCEHVHNSVYVPICRFDMNRWLLRRTCLPDDLLDSYFPTLERVNRYKRHIIVLFP